MVRYVRAPIRTAQGSRRSVRRTMAAAAAMVVTLGRARAVQRPGGRVRARDLRDALPTTGVGVPATSARCRRGDHALLAASLLAAHGSYAIGRPVPQVGVG